MDHSRPLFIYFCLFNTVDSKQKFADDYLDSNRGPLVLEEATLPTEPQPLPNLPNCFCLRSNQIRKLHPFLAKLSFCKNTSIGQRKKEANLSSFYLFGFTFLCGSGQVETKVALGQRFLRLRLQLLSLFSDRQCDQNGQFFKLPCKKITHKWSQNLKCSG